MKASIFHCISVEDRRKRVQKYTFSNESGLMWTAVHCKGVRIIRNTLILRRCPFRKSYAAENCLHHAWFDSSCYPPPLGIHVFFIPKLSIPHPWANKEKPIFLPWAILHTNTLSKFQMSTFERHSLSDRTCSLGLVKAMLLQC
jgi:hypothetical protein